MHLECDKAARIFFFFFKSFCSKQPARLYHKTPAMSLSLDADSFLGGKPDPMTDNVTAALQVCAIVMGCQAGVLTPATHLPYQ
jgi:hypothetical protein